MLESQIIDGLNQRVCVEGAYEGWRKRERDPGACQIDLRENIFRAFTLGTHILNRLFCKHNTALIFSLSKAIPVVFLVVGRKSSKDQKRSEKCPL